MLRIGSLETNCGSRTRMSEDGDDTRPNSGTNRPFESTLLRSAMRSAMVDVDCWLLDQRHEAVAGGNRATGFSDPSTIVPLPPMPTQQRPTSPTPHLNLRL